MPGSVLRTQLAPSSHVNDSLSLYPKTDSGFLRAPGPSSSELTSSMPPLVPAFTALLSPPASAGALVRAHSAIRRWSAPLCLSQAQPQGPRAPALASYLQLVSLHRGRAHSHPTELPPQPFSLPPSLSRWCGWRREDSLFLSACLLPAFSSLGQLGLLCPMRQMRQPRRGWLRRRVGTKIQPTSAPQTMHPGLGWCQSKGKGCLFRICTKTLCELAAALSAPPACRPTYLSTGCLSLLAPSHPAHTGPSFCPSIHP